MDFESFSTRKKNTSSQTQRIHKAVKDMGPMELGGVF